MLIKSPYPNLPSLPDCNVHHLYFKRPDQAAWPDYTVHIDAETNERIMYSQMVSNIEYLSTGLATPPAKGGLGIARDDRIAIMGVNSSEYIQLVHACIRAAIIFVPIAPHATAFELNYAFSVVNPTHLFVDEKLLEFVLPIARRAAINNRNIFVLKKHDRRKEIQGRKSCSDIVEDLKKRDIKLLGVHPATKDTIVYLIFSSGTSGPPKAVKISHGNLISNTGQNIVFRKVAAAIGSPLASIPVTLGVLPLYHAFGLNAYCFRPCLSPSTLVILPRWNLKLVLEAIPRYRVSSLIMVPPFMYQMVNYPGIENVDFSSVTSITFGASSTPLDMQLSMKKIISQKAQFLEGYGMSETTVSAVVQPLHGGPGNLKAIPGSTGVLVPGMEGRIVREDGSDAEVNEPGELLLRGPNITSGYWMNEKANKEAFQDGWLRTGDIFRVDQNGYFWFRDRVKDTLKVSGSQVSPFEIESCLLAHPDKLIADVVVAGVSGGLIPDKIPRAWVVLSAAGMKLGKEKAIQLLDSWHRQNLSRYKHLRGGIELVAEIPKSATGKPLRRVLQEEHERKLKQNHKAKL